MFGSCTLTRDKRQRLITESVYSRLLAHRCVASPSLARSDLGELVPLQAFRRAKNMYIHRLRFFRLAINAAVRYSPEKFQWEHGLCQ